MEIYLALLSLYALCGYLIHRIIKLNRKINEQDLAHKKALAEAGNAITDTLRVAFDNIKRQGSEMSKITNKQSEYQSRLHRLEQTLQQIISKNNKNIATEQKEELKNEKRNSKTG